MQFPIAIFEELKTESTKRSEMTITSVALMTLPNWHRCDLHISKAGLGVELNEEKSPAKLTVTRFPVGDEALRNMLHQKLGAKTPAQLAEEQRRLSKSKKFTWKRAESCWQEQSISYSNQELESVSVSGLKTTPVFNILNKSRDL